MIYPLVNILLARAILSFSNLWYNSLAVDGFIYLELSFFFIRPGFLVFTKIARTSFSRVMFIYYVLLNFAIVHMVS